MLLELQLGCGTIYKLVFTLNGQSRRLYQKGPCRISTREKLGYGTVDLDFT